MFGVDYAFSPHPKTADMKARGVKFVGRYVSPSAAADKDGKNLLPAEKHELLTAGFELLLYAEWYAARMNEGRKAGVADAQHFDQVTKSMGLDGIVMYCAADWDVSGAQQANVNAYLDGAASVLGLARTGIYGGFWAVTRALNGGHATYAVQTRAWSSYSSSIPMPPHATKWEVDGHWYFADMRAQVRQGAFAAIDGVQCDRLTSLADDFGQFPRPAPPAPKGPYRHVVPAGNTVSLTKLAADRGTRVDALTELAAQHLNPVNLGVFNAYLALAVALNAAKEPAPAMPEGFVYYTVHP